MFTGIITEIGSVKSVTHKDNRVCLRVKCDKVFDPVVLGGSVSVNGVCLSVVRKDADRSLTFDVVGNTLEKTNLKRAKTGQKVNLEQALKLGDDMSGHIVTGHVDAERKIKKNRAMPGNWVLDINVTSDDKNYMVSKGAIAIDGVSLTIGEIHNDFFRVFLIPLTLEKTTLKLKKQGDYVNLEFDAIAKYAKNDKGSAINFNLLRDKGFV
ncbi:MAG: riboflavin synthase [Candidatus Omnitrophica bacterium]|nr:riboflavin synthase [Candidatus Omnitrophota bacterium]